MESTTPGRSLQEVLEPLFPVDERRRGTELSLDGAVDVRHGDDLKVNAVVRAPSPHAVSLSFEDGDLRYTCPCEVAPAKPCRHLFAVVMEAGMLGLLRGVRRQGSVRLRASRPPAVDERPRVAPTAAAEETPIATPPDWESRLSQLETALASGEATSSGAWPRDQQLLYLIDVDASRADGCLVVRLARREKRTDGTYGRVRVADLSAAEQEGLTDPRDRAALEALRGAVSRGRGSRATLGAFAGLHNPLVLPRALQAAVGPLLVETARCHLLEDGASAGRRPLRFDAQGWTLRLRISRADDGDWVLRGELCRDTERIDVAEPLLVTDGLVVRRDRMASLDASGGRHWIDTLRRSGPIRVPASHGEALMKRLLAIPKVPPLVVPKELQVEEARVKPRPVLRLESPPDRQLVEAPLVAEVSFDYDGWLVRAGADEQRHFQEDTRRVILRNPMSERDAIQLLADLGVEEIAEAEEPVFELPKDRMMRVVRELVDRKWLVELGGRIVRPPVQLAVDVRTDVDWFELFGSVQFDDVETPLPDVLKAVRRGEELAPLRDGSFGLLHPRWKQRYGLLAGLGVERDQSLRFERRRLAVLDAVLADEIELTFDQAYQRARDRLRRFRGLAAVDPPPTFQGELRPYQREALGWFKLLAEFGLGGCLADDMGLGKTVQVLALLELRRALGLSGGRPSIVIAPRSLVFNWAREARHFAPELKILDHRGKDRPKAPEDVRDHLVLTTYGVLVRDVELLREVDFDYVVLDEAQTIKNRGTRTSKAALALSGRQRLALSGTPIENNVGELLNLFEFLNPGLLGSSTLQRKVGVKFDPTDEESVDTMRKLIRPFVLRRTKREVAKDLPRKTEQVIRIDLSEEERETYDEIRRYYRGSLLERIRRDGIHKSRMHVLEGLLRLRQAACHRGLFDPERRADRGAKLELLLDQLSELVKEGHKAVVFSQFTRFLSIVRQHLDREGIRYSYLDGQTADRQAEVLRFQSDESIPVFLISIKAGGVGLNLTAADYVFLLDPWWNPAVEAQAIDRAYRIGQKRPVFAYRLIARDTIEERVLDLQREKRELFDALLEKREDAGLSRSDLEALLS